VVAPVFISDSPVLFISGSVLRTAYPAAMVKCRRAPNSQNALANLFQRLGSQPRDLDSLRLLQ
jgi:hypothetical protein